MRAVPLAKVGGRAPRTEEVRAQELTLHSGGFPILSGAGGSWVTQTVTRMFRLRASWGLRGATGLHWGQLWLPAPVCDVFVRQSDGTVGHGCLSQLLPPKTLWSPFSVSSHCSVITS